MRNKRITTLMLSGIMALSSVGFTATVASADYDEHPNVIIQAAIRLDNIAETNNNYRKANQSLQMLRDMRHWAREHRGRAPRLVSRGGSECRDAYRDWFDTTRTLARIGFRTYRGNATKWQEYPDGYMRQTVKYRQRLLLARAQDNQADSTDEFIDECIFNLPRRARRLLF